MADYLAYLLNVMTVVGMWPRDWPSPWLNTIYVVYSRGLNVTMVCYLVAKLLLTYQVRTCDKFLQQIFESAFLSVLTFQRLAFCFSTDKIKGLVRILNEDLKSCRLYSTNIAKKYNKFEKWITIAFAAATAFGVTEVILNNKSLCSTCEAQYEDKFNADRRLYIEVWLPYDETVSPLYEITDALITSLVLITSVHIYIFSVIIPLFVLETCCQFRSVASISENSLRIKKKNSSTIYVSIKEAIKYHQQILELSHKLNNCFHSIVGLKLVFLSFPIIVSVFAITKRIEDVHIEGMLLFMVQLVIELFVFCWFGEQLRYHSLLLHHSIYNSRWYDMDPVDQRCLQIVLVRSQRPSMLEVMPYFKPANLETFLAVSQFSYSLYTLMYGLTK